MTFNKILVCSLFSIAILSGCGSDAYEYGAELAITQQPATNCEDVNQQLGNRTNTSPLSRTDIHIRRRAINDCNEGFQDTVEAARDSSETAAYHRGIRHAHGGHPITRCGNLQMCSANIGGNNAYPTPEDVNVMRIISTFECETMVHECQRGFHSVGR